MVARRARSYLFSPIFRSGRIFLLLSVLLLAILGSDCRRSRRSVSEAPGKKAENAADLFQTTRKPSGKIDRLVVCTPEDSLSQQSMLAVAASRAGGLAYTESYHKIQEKERERVLAEGVHARSFAGLRPDLLTILKVAERNLGISSPVDLYISNRDQQLLGVYNLDPPAIYVSSKLLRQEFSAEEWLFILGHLLGHLHANHPGTIYFVDGAKRHGLGIIAQLSDYLRVVDYTVDMWILPWRKDAEISADRAGLIACQDLDVAARALFLLKTGLSGSDIDGVRLNEYFKHHAQPEAPATASAARAKHPEPDTWLGALKNISGQVSQQFIAGMQYLSSRIPTDRDELEIEQSVPFLYERMQQLQQFEKSEHYRRLFRR